MGYAASLEGDENGKNRSTGLIGRGRKLPQVFFSIGRKWRVWSASSSNHFMFEKIFCCFLGSWFRAS
jgi:hypothetical protein